ncbi:hypothetical protein WN944_013886 [Citrus x changshan-huyou]|uniref:Cysteinyl-tRNA ligase anticodon binding domain-containing protein n=2 Tax=Citrus TaxID=2706 RepID=A0AAP0M9M1_9ROSI
MKLVGSSNKHKSCEIDTGAEETLQDCEVALSPFQEDARSGSITPAAEDCIKKLRDEFYTRMSDDLNTSHILTGAFLDALKFINNSKKQPKQQQLSLIESLLKIENEVKVVLDVLGLLPEGSTYSEVLQQLKDKALKRAELAENDVLHLIEERATAKKNKDFSKSDQIRADLTRKGIALMDVRKETIWRPCVPVEQEQEAPLVEKEQQLGEEQKA